MLNEAPDLPRGQYVFSFACRHGLSGVVPEIGAFLGIRRG